jgi:uncharacterized protein with PIN domain
MTKKQIEELWSEIYSIRQSLKTLRIDVFGDTSGKRYFCPDCRGILRKIKNPPALDPHWMDGRPVYACYQCGAKWNPHWFDNYDTYEIKEERQNEI